MVFAISLAAALATGAVAGWHFTKTGYEAKLTSITTEVRAWQGHAIAEVRTFAARIKALL